MLCSFKFNSCLILKKKRSEKLRYDSARDSVSLQLSVFFLPLVFIIVAVVTNRSHQFIRFS